MIDHPNYTQVPNSLLDTMSNFSPPQFKVMMAICRQTFGWHRKSCQVSLRELVKTTGISKRCLMGAVEFLVTGGFIRRDREEDGITTTTYSIVFKDNAQPDEEVAANTTGSSGKCPTPVAGDAPPINIKKEEKKRDGLPEIPKSLDTEGFRRAWGDWMQDRKDRRKPMTRKAIEVQLFELEKMGLNRALNAIAHSIASGYQGIFEPKSSTPAQKVSYSVPNITPVKP